MRFGKRVENTTREDIYDDVCDELDMQLERWGTLPHPSGTFSGYKVASEMMKINTDYLAKVNGLTWRDIVSEELLEAFAEEYWPKTRSELIQTAAVIFSWIIEKDKEHAGN